MIIKPLSENTLTNKNYVGMEDCDIGKSFRAIATGFKEVPATTYNGMEFAAHREQFYEDNNYIYVTKFYEGKGKDIIAGNEYTLVCKAGKTGRATLYCNQFSSEPLKFQKFTLKDKLMMPETEVEVISVKPTTGQYAQPNTSQIILKWTDGSNKAFSIVRENHNLPIAKKKYFLSFDEKQTKKGNVITSILKPSLPDGAVMIGSQEEWMEYNKTLEEKI